MEKESNGNGLVVDSDETINEEVSLFDEMNFTEKSAAMKKAFHEYLKRVSHEGMKQIYAHFNKVIHEKSIIQCRVKTKRIPNTGEFLPKSKVVSQQTMKYQQ